MTTEGRNTGSKSPRLALTGRTWNSFLSTKFTPLPLSTLLQFFIPLVSLHIHSFQNYTTCIFLQLSHPFWKIIFSTYIHYPGLFGLHSQCFCCNCSLFVQTLPRHFTLIICNDPEYPSVHSRSFKVKGSDARECGRMPALPGWSVNGPIPGSHSRLPSRRGPTCARALLRQHAFQSRHVIEAQPVAVRGFVPHRYCPDRGIFEKQVLAMIVRGVEHFEPILIVVISEQVLEAPQADTLFIPAHKLSPRGHLLFIALHRT